MKPHKTVEKSDRPRRNPAARSRSEQSRALETRGALIAVARQLFSEVGYHATGTTEIVARAKVTRGALYHHFADKEALFEAVYCAAAQELSEKAQAATVGMAGQTWPRMFATLTVYLELVAHRRDYQRILLVDGPAVFGWQRWRALRADYSLEGWVRTLSMLAEQGIIADAPHEPMAHLILAAMDDAAMEVAHAADPDAALCEMTAALSRLLGGLRIG